MEPEIDQFLNSKIEECLNSPVFLGLDEPQKQQIRETFEDFFSELIFSTILKNATDEQLTYIEQLDLTDPKNDEKIQLIAAQIPGFIFIVEEEIDTAVKTIVATGKLPE